MQRWLVNQRSCQRILKELPVYYRWATMMHERLLVTNWRRRVAGEVARMLLLPEILVALHFEAELGLFFEQTMRWHSTPGELYCRAGFRMLEIHRLYHNYIIPWWQGAYESPKLRFPKTYEYLEHHIADGVSRDRKKRQIEAGIKAGYMEQIKMVNELLRPPCFFDGWSRIVLSPNKWSRSVYCQRVFLKG